MNWKKLLFIALLVVAAIWYRQNTLANRETLTPAPIDELTNETNIEAIAAQHTFAAESDGQTAEELLDKNVDAQYTDYGEAGKFVASIDGLSSDAGHYWAFYVNGEYSQTGVSQTSLKKGDIITFTYETVDPDQL